MHICRCGNMFSSSILAIALVVIGTSSIEGVLVLNISTANHVMNVLRSSRTIDLATKLILEQAPLQSSLPEDWSLLKTEQVSLKTAARTWRSDTRSELFRLNDGIIAFTEQFAAFYDFLEELSDRLGDEETRSDFVALVDELKSEVIIRQSEANITAYQLKAFNHSIITLEKILDKACDSIESIYTGQNGVVQKLSRQIAAIDKELARLNEPANVTMDSSKQLAHDREIAANYSRLSNEKQKLNRQRVELQLALREAHTLQSNVKSLANNVNQTIVAVDQIVVAWNQLELEYGDFAKIVESSQETVEDIKKTLNDANKQRLELNQRAYAIKRNLLKNQAHF